MTYLQLMIKCLNFYKDEENKFDIDNFYFHWFASDDNNIETYYKSKATKAIIYLFLKEAKKCSNPHNQLLELLEKDLSYFDLSMCKTFEKAEEKAVTSLIEDPYTFDQICLLEQDELTDEEENEIFNKYFNNFLNQMPKELEVQQYESAIHTIMEMTSEIIPELFFTEKGYKYIDKEYQIDDVKLREKCYEYLKDNIKYYNYERIYKVDENIYNKFYKTEKELNQVESLNEEYNYDEDEIRGQIDIYGEDIDNYDILYYSTTLLVVILRFIKNKQFDKIEKLIEIDDEMTNFYDDCGLYHDKTFIEAIYQPKTMDKDYHREISTPPKSDFYLDFFLSNNEFTQQYTTKQLSLIIAYCFNLFDSEPIDKIYKNIDIINDILATNYPNNKIEKIKRLVRLKKNNR